MDAFNPILKHIILILILKIKRNLLRKKIRRILYKREYKIIEITTKLLFSIVVSIRVVQQLLVV